MGFKSGQHAKTEPIPVSMQGSLYHAKHEVVDPQRGSPSRKELVDIVNVLDRRPELAERLAPISELDEEVEKRPAVHSGHPAGHFQAELGSNGRPVAADRLLGAAQRLILGALDVDLDEVDGSDIEIVEAHAGH